LGKRTPTAAARPPRASRDWLAARSSAATRQLFAAPTDTILATSLALIARFAPLVAPLAHFDRATFA
jgi:hypothetical protein